MSSDQDDQSDETMISETVVCAGPPYCNLRGDKALRAQQGGCIWCSRIYTETDDEGKVLRESIDQPGIA